MRARRKSQARTAAKPTPKHPERPGIGAMYRQGDVLLRWIEDADLSGTHPVETDGGRCVLAYGEATGHAHTLNASHAELRESRAGRFLSVRKRTALQHEEHDPIDLPPGLYEVIRQREFTDAPRPAQGNDAHSLWGYADGAWRVVRD